MSLILNFRVFLDIFEAFAEDRFLLRSFRKFLTSGFLPLSLRPFNPPRGVLGSFGPKVPKLETELKMSCRGLPAPRSKKLKTESISGPQKGPAERGHVKKRQKSSKSVKKFFDTYRQFSRRAKNVKKCQKHFDNFRAAPFFSPFWGTPSRKKGQKSGNFNSLSTFLTLFSTLFLTFRTLGPEGPGNSFLTPFPTLGPKGPRTPLGGRKGFYP